MMKFLPKVLLVLFLLFLVVTTGFIPQKISAQTIGTSCESIGVIITANPNPVIPSIDRTITFTVQSNASLDPETVQSNASLDPESVYYIALESVFYNWDFKSEKKQVPAGTSTFTINLPLVINLATFDQAIELRRTTGGADAQVCRASEKLQVLFQPNEESNTCDTLVLQPFPVDQGDKVNVSITNLDPNIHLAVFAQPPIPSLGDGFTTNTNSSGNASGQFGPLNKTGLTVITVRTLGGKLVCSRTIVVEEFNPSTESSEDLSTTEYVFDLCKSAGDFNSPEYDKCIECLKEDSNSGIWTGLGCLKTNPKDFVQDLLTIAIGLGGGIAFLLIIYGSFVLTTAAGVPDNIQKGREIIGGAVSGLLFIIFSVVLLNLIGVQILQIPGL